MDYTTLGTRIKNMRQQKKLTQEQLAEQAGISAPFIGHIERGTRIASLETLVAICNALEVSPEYLLCDSLVPAACASPANVTGRDVAQLRKQLQGALEIVERLSTSPSIAPLENAHSNITLEALM